MWLLHFSPISCMEPIFLMSEPCKLQENPCRWFWECTDIHAHQMDEVCHSTGWLLRGEMPGSPTWLVWDWDCVWSRQQLIQWLGIGGRRSCVWLMNSGCQVNFCCQSSGLFAQCFCIGFWCFEILWHVFYLPVFKLKFLQFWTHLESLFSGQKPHIRGSPS